jgi:cytochrome P450
LKTGPVIRIAPDEIHLSDPENYEKIYHTGSKFSKSPGFYSAFGYGTAAFSTPSNELHRVRRAALNPLFSRRRVLDLEDVVQSKVAKLDHRLSVAASGGAAVDLHHALRAISVDTITDYGFGSCYNLLDHDDFGTQFFATMRELGPAVWFFQQWPLLQTLALNIPPWLARALSKNLGSFMQLQEVQYSNLIGVFSNFCRNVVST